MRSFINSQLLILKTVGLTRYSKKYPYWVKKKLNNLFLKISTDIKWDAGLYKYKLKKSSLSGKWFGSSKLRNLENFLPSETMDNISTKASLAKDLKFFINNELIDYNKSPCNSRLDIDPKSGNKWPLTSIYSNIDNSLGDIRYPWEVGRLHQLVWFGQQWKISGDCSWKHLGLEHIDKLMSENPLYYGIHSRDGLQIAIRLFSIIAFADLCHESDMSFHEHVTASVIANSKMLKAQLSPDSEVTNNHAIGEYAAIMLSGIYLNDSKMIQFSSKNLKKELDRQIYDDGISYEGTIPYLRFNLDFLTLLYKAFKAVETNPPKYLSFYINKIANSLSGLIDKQGFIPPIGDGDDGRVIKFDNEDYLCVNESLQLASILMKKVYATQPSNFSFAYWISGFDSINIKENKKLSLFKDSGLLHYNNNKIDLWLDCGPTGMGINGLGGHGHNDTTSFVVHYDNKGIFHDPGWYTYHSDSELRNFFRSTKNHNTITIDDEEQARFKSTFEIFNDCKPSNLKVKINDNLISIQCGHTGYLRLNKDISYIRHIHIIESNEINIVVTDKVISSIPINVRNNLGSDLKWNKDKHKNTYNSGLFKIIFEHLSCKIDLERNLYSRKNLSLKEGVSFKWLLNKKKLNKERYVYRSRFRLVLNK